MFKYSKNSICVWCNLILFFYLVFNQNLLAQTKKISFLIPRPPLSINFFGEIIADPIFGEYLCRPLVRPDDDKQGFRYIIARDLKEFRKSQKSEDWVWQVSLRTDLSWSDGSTFDALELKKLVESHLVSVLSKHYPYSAPLPEFGTEIVNATTLNILWKKNPSTGVFSLARLPILKALDEDSASAERSDLMAAQCVGRYRVVSANSSKAVLVRKSKQSTVDPERIEIIFSKQPNEKVDVEIFLAAHQNNSNRLSDEPIPCTIRYLSPYITSIKWNPNSNLVVSSELRKTLTQAIPRGEIVRAGTGFLGELLTVPLDALSIVDSTALKLIPFDLNLASAKLDTLGWKRKNSRSVRTKSDGTELNLTILTSNSSNNLVQKIIFDSFASIGVGINFVTETSLPPSHTVDGHLVTFFSDRPFYDLFSTYKFEDIKDFYKKSSSSSLEVDKLTRDFSIGLTKGQFDKSKLASIQKHFYDEEVQSVLFQHKYCVRFDKRDKYADKFEYLFSNIK